MIRLIPTLLCPNFFFNLSHPLLGSICGSLIQIPCKIA